MPSFLPSVSSDDLARSLSLVQSASGERRIRIIVAYDGTDFHGWQIQSELPTIQGTLEAIVSNIDGRPVTVHGSGRTDAGVHAEAQVAAFSLSNPIPVDNLRRALNRLLPPSIRVLRAEQVDHNFHPRFDAIAKTYEYRLYRGEVCPPWLWRYVYHHPYPLHLDAMHASAAVLEGEHDFTAFSSADDRDTAARSKVRRIFSSTLLERDNTLLYRVRGSGFLKHMVRNLVGTLLEAGKGNANADTIGELLQAAAHAKARNSAPARGLHLISVEYPDPPLL